MKDNDKNKNQLSQNGASRRPPPPRPIYARFVNEADKDYILRRAPRILKDNPYGPTQAKIIITDDVSSKVSADRKLLREKELPEIRKRPGVKVAFISYPAGRYSINRTISGNSIFCQTNEVLSFEEMY